MIPAVVAVTMTLACPAVPAAPDAPACMPQSATTVQPTPAISLRTTPPPFVVPAMPQEQTVQTAAQEIPAGGAPVPASAPIVPPASSDVAQSADPADIVVTAKKQGSREGDPVAAVNEVAFAATQAVDTAVVRPVAMGYARVVPKPLRNGLRNFLYNLAEPVVFLNFLLQLKPGKAMETVGRFGINTSLGVGGLFDFARRKPFHLPRRDNTLADTLGYYGVKPGPFLFLPIVGPTTLRDLFGNTLDSLLLPTVVGSPFNKRAFTLAIGLGGSLDDRVENDAKIAAQRKGPYDAYTTNRDAYLALRKAEIDHLRGGDVPRPKDAIERNPVRTRLPIQ